MDDEGLGLATRCHICYIRQGIYKCPKCLRRSCSVACVKTHKKRSRCDGVRDPTEPKPLNWLRTPAGIDHDFNFLSNIERSIQRNNKGLVEDGLFTENELKGYVDVEDERDPNGNIVRTVQKEIRKRIYACDIDVRRVPRGMTRERENKTSFCRNKRKGVNWQVEWVLVKVREHPALDGKTLDGQSDTTIFHKVIEWKPLFRALEETLEWFRSSLLNPDEKEKDAHERHRRRYRSRGRRRHRIRLHQEGDDEVAEEVMSQNMETCTWSPGEYLQQDPITGWWNQELGSTLVNMFDFYLHVPQWPSTTKKVLMPLGPTENLTTALCGRTIVEFPTIYVLPAGTPIPSSYQVQLLVRRPPGHKTRQGGVEEDLREAEAEPMDVNQEELEQGDNPPNEEVGRDDIDSGTSSSNDTTSADDSSSEDGEISGAEISHKLQESTHSHATSQPGHNAQSKQRGHGRGQGRGSRDNRGGRAGRSGRHPDQMCQREQSLKYNEKNGRGDAQHQPGFEPRRQKQEDHSRDKRGSHRGQRGRGPGGGHHWSDRGGRVGGQGLPMSTCSSGVVPQKRASEDREEVSMVDTRSKRPKASTGLVSYDSDSDSGPEEFTAVLQTVAGMDAKRMGG